MRLFEHLQSYGVVASAVARVNGALEAAKTSENSLVKLTLTTAETYVVPTVQRAVEHVVERYPLAIDYLDNYSCLALERTETTLANASQRLTDAKRTVSEAPAVAVNRAFELTEQLIDRVLPAVQTIEETEQEILSEASSSSSSTSSSSSSSSSETTSSPSSSSIERAQAIAQLVSLRLRQRIDELPKPQVTTATLIDFARARQQQINSAVCALDGFTLRLRESVAQAGSSATLSFSAAVHSAHVRIEPFAHRLHLDQHLSSARALLSSASDAARSLIEAAKANQHVANARLNFLARFAQARNGVVSALDAVGDHLPKALLPAFARFHDLVSFLLTVPEVEDLKQDEEEEKREKLEFAAVVLPSAPPATFDSSDDDDDDAASEEDANESGSESETD